MKEEMIMNKTAQNLTWNCLPLAVKKEVKRQYQIATNAKEYFTECTLEYLFGATNLTSDAEGEEMLIVSRRKVQEMYSAFEEFKDKDNTCFNLETLFGSKCLPDEEPKPAEPFKVGDKVKVKGYGYEPNLHKGDIGEILDINDKEQCFVLFKKSQAWIYVDCLEPYTAADQQPTSATQAKIATSAIQVPHTYDDPAPYGDRQPPHVTDSEFDDVIKRAIKTYGKEAQTQMLFEEMAELQDALCKLARGRGTAGQVCEEIADVMIMCRQMALIYGPDLVDRWTDYKITRLKIRLNKSENENN